MAPVVVSVAAVATIAAISFHIFRSQSSSTTSSEETEENESTNLVSKEKGNEMNDSSENTTESTAPKKDAEVIASPSSKPKGPKTAKGKKWRDRITAQKNKKKLSKTKHSTAKAE